MNKRENFKIGTLNKTDVYILPMITDIGIALKHDKQFPQDCFRNTFLGDKTHPEFKEGKIMLLYRLPFQSTDNVFKWNNFETYLHSLPNFITDYKADRYHRMFVYDVPELFKEDYYKFLEWKPSQFSNLYKERIRLFYGNIKDDSPLMGVLNKSEERFRWLENEYKITIPRNQEASSEPYWDEEYYQEVYKERKILEKEIYG